MTHFFLRLSLARQFLLVSFPILFAATLLIGWWIGRQVQDSVLRRLGGATALYVDAFVARHVQRLAEGALDLAETDRVELAACCAAPRSATGSCR